MKKIRPDKSQPQTITLSSKRGSLNQEQLFVPYKIDWKNSPLQNMENSSSKVFFQNMKAELSNIKNDFEKLIKKEGPSHNEKEDDFKSASKPKCQSAYKKDVKKVVFDRYPENEKFQIVKNNREESDHYFKILNLQKNLPCSSGSDFKNSCSKTVTLKDNIIKEKASATPFDTIEIQRNQRAQSSRERFLPDHTKVEQKEKEMNYLRETLSTLQIELKETKEERDFTKKQAQKLFSEKNVLISKMTELSNELGYKVELALQQQAKIKKLNEDMKRYEEHFQQKQSIENEFCNERNFYNDRINELMFHNQNLGNINMELGSENQMLKENLANFERYAEELKRQGSDLDTDSNRKLEYMQREIQQYQKRENMFSKEIEKLNFELRQAHETSLNPYTNSVQQAPNQTVNEQILQLKDQIFHLTNQVNIQKEIHQTLSKRYQEQIASLKIEEISREFEDKFNKLIDQNCKLKCRVNFCESSLESMNQQNQSYIMQINLYEEREKKLIATRQLSSSEWQELTEQIEKLTEQNKRLQDEIQYKNLKHQAEPTPQLPSVNSDSLIRMANMQLFENQKLKETIKELSLSLKLSEQKIQSLKLTQLKLNEAAMLKENSAEVAKLGRRHEELYAEIETKNNQIRNIKDLIFKVLIEKTNKLEDEEELQYYLREIQNKRDLLQI